MSNATLLCLQNPNLEQIDTGRLSVRTQAEKPSAITWLRRRLTLSSRNSQLFKGIANEEMHQLVEIFAAIFETLSDEYGPAATNMGTAA